ncbi:hypothetical protein SAMN02745166_02739 [Prosthecobacter debontii]|uniref:N-acetyltransferase domain-containing protein n=1 Tax=Prosthecobacter debontii TaxID=48467 RepID=A0A1T4Y971_9BACT|nr:GNAT family N-acetyltransferase [Prosthecobacter debontii]SKA98367.1 hypothetical protein SAMN02745166_02739 [Prosthecobacter debontii]
MLRLQNFQGQEIEPYLDALGALRITVFRDFPYLYDGNLDYERDYLKVYMECPRSMAVLAFHGDAVVGASTCMPMEDEGPEFQEPFRRNDHDLSKICYLGESILLSQYRGRGVGKKFFIEREKHAQSLGMRMTTFCAVNRPLDHSLRPANYQSLDSFWQSRGYVKQPDMQATFHWKDVNEEHESAKTLTFWTKTLA